MVYISSKSKSSRWDRAIAVGCRSLRFDSRLGGDRREVFGLGYLDRDVVSRVRV